MVQRFNMCNTMTKGRQAMGFATFLIISTIGISVFIGMATLAYYYGKDPLCLGPNAVGSISYPDQIVPKLVVDIFTTVPGFTGVFIVAVYSATIRTVSHPALCKHRMEIYWETFLSSFSAFLSGSALVFLPIVQNLFNLPDDLQVRTSRFIIVTVGSLTVILSIAISFNPGTILGTLFMTTTNLGAPFFGTALCGMFLPFVNRKGILAGMFAPVVPVSIYIVQQILKIPRNIKAEMLTTRLDCTDDYRYPVKTFGCQVYQNIIK